MAITTRPRVPMLQTAATCAVLVVFARGLRPIAEAEEVIDPEEPVAMPEVLSEVIPGYSVAMTSPVDYNALENLARYVARWSTMPATTDVAGGVADERSPPLVSHRRPTRAAVLAGGSILASIGQADDPDPLEKAGDALSEDITGTQATGAKPETKPLPVADAPNNYETTILEPAAQEMIKLCSEVDKQKAVQLEPDAMLKKVQECIQTVGHFADKVKEAQKISRNMNVLYSKEVKVILDNLKTLTDYSTTQHAIEEDHKKAADSFMRLAASTQQTITTLVARQ